MDDLANEMEPHTMKVVKLGENNYSLSVATEDKIHTWNNLSHALLVSTLELVQKNYGPLEILGQEYLQ